jgi:uncharacterized integral membrane protein (TIGR00697 family)
MGIVVVCLYVACEIIANVTAGKPVRVFSLVVPSAVFIYTLTFTLIDLLHEIYGRDGARKVIIGAFLGNALLACYSVLVVKLPPAPFFSEGRAYEIVFGQTPRIVFASLTAYLVSSLLDVEVYHLWRRRVKAQRWSRVIVSNGVSTFVDSVVFISIAFLGLMPVSALILGQYVVKMAVSLVTVPLIYATRATVLGQA